MKGRGNAEATVAAAAMAAFADMRSDSHNGAVLAYAPLFVIDPHIAAIAAGIAARARLAADRSLNEAPAVTPQSLAVQQAMRLKSEKDAKNDFMLQVPEGLSEDDQVTLLTGFNAFCAASSRSSNQLSIQVNKMTLTPRLMPLLLEMAKRIGFIEFLNCTVDEKFVGALQQMRTEAKNDFSINALRILNSQSSAESLQKAINVVYDAKSSAVFIQKDSKGFSCYCRAGKADGLIHHLRVRGKDITNPNEFLSLFQALPPTGLKHLHITNQAFEFNGTLKDAKNIAEMKDDKMVHLDLSHNKMLPSSLSDFATLRESFPQLRVLTLDHLTFSASNIQSEMLAELSKITHLDTLSLVGWDLRQNEDYLIKLISSNNKLRNIDLSGAQCSDKLVTSLVDWLRDKPDAVLTINNPPPALKKALDIKKHLPELKALYLQADEVLSSVSVQTGSDEKSVMDLLSQYSSINILHDFGVPDPTTINSLKLQYEQQLIVKIRELNNLANQEKAFGDFSRFLHTKILPEFIKIKNPEVFQKVIQHYIAHGLKCPQVSKARLAGNLKILLLQVSESNRAAVKEVVRDFLIQLQADIKKPSDSTSLAQDKEKAADLAFTLASMFDFKDLKMFYFNAGMDAQRYLCESDRLKGAPQEIKRISEAHDSKVQMLAGSLDQPSFQEATQFTEFLQTQSRILALQSVSLALRGKELISETVDNQLVKIFPAVLTDQQYQQVEQCLVKIFIQRILIIFEKEKQSRTLGSRSTNFIALLEEKSKSGTYSLRQLKADVIKYQGQFNVLQNRDIKKILSSLVTYLDQKIADLDGAKNKQKASLPFGTLAGQNSTAAMTSAMSTGAASKKEYKTASAAAGPVSKRLYPSVPLPQSASPDFQRQQKTSMAVGTSSSSSSSSSSQYNQNSRREGESEAPMYSAAAAAARPSVVASTTSMASTVSQSTDSSLQQEGSVRPVASAPPLEKEQQQQVEGQASAPPPPREPSAAEIAAVVAMPLPNASSVEPSAPSLEKDQQQKEGQAPQQPEPKSRVMIKR